MFQTPQRKAAGGIMAGVAPMYEGMGPMKLRGGGDPGILSDFSLSLTQDDDKFNLRDITDFFFDPSDPLDYATLGLLAFPLHLRRLDLQRWESVQRKRQNKLVKCRPQKMLR